MKRRTLVLGTAAAAVATFSAGALLLRPKLVPSVASNVLPPGSALVRPDAPILGPEDAPVTLVEFFDPACEACRAFHPIVLDIRAQYPNRLRVVMRYAAFHDGSDEALAILEAARRQSLFKPVLEALYESQPRWADHGTPRLEFAWNAAADAGLDLELARRDVQSPEIQAYLVREREDIETVGVRQTPTFFVNGRPLMQFGEEPLRSMIKLQVEGYNS